MNDEIILRTMGCVILVALVGFVSPEGAFGLTLETTASEPSVRGESIRAKIRVAASGIQQDPTFPLESVSGTVGESFEMGSLDSIPERRVELLVTLPRGQYYRNVTREELTDGTIELTVYPVGDNSELEISRHGILVQPFPNRLMVREYIVFTNKGQSMAGGPDQPVEFNLPETMDRVIPGPGMGDSDEMSEGEEGYRYRNLIPPGESMMGFFYMIRPETGRFVFERSPTVPTGKFAVRVPSYEKLSVTAEGLRKARQRPRSGESPSGHTPQIYRASNLSPGDSIRITFEGLNEISPPGPMQGQSGSGEGEAPDGELGSRPSSFSNVSWPLILGIGFSVLIFVGSYGYVQYKLASIPESGTDEDFLIRELATLDQEYEDGAIDEAYYKRTRRRWKRKAEALSDDEST